MSTRLVNKDAPASSSKSLRMFSSEPKFNNGFHCRRTIGKLKFLGKGTRPDVAHAVYQCARFCEDPKASHVLAVKRAFRYLKNAKNEELILNPADDSFKHMQIVISVHSGIN